jgi:two-component system nitrogen regulation sensor histidine kinase NtrY
MLYQSDFATKISESSVANFEETLHEKEQQTKELIKGLQAHVERYGTKKAFDKFFQPRKDLFQEEGILLLAYRNDSLKIWTTNSVPLESIKKDDALERDILQVSNGKYRVLQKKKDGIEYYGLILIKHEYSYDNKYLVSEFHSDFNFPYQADVVLQSDKDHINIKSKQGKYLFSIKTNKDQVTPSRYTLIAIITLLGFILFIVFLVKEFEYLGQYIGWMGATMLFIIMVFLLRYWSLVMVFPDVFYQLELFSPTLYGTSFLFPSLGDFLINAILLFGITYYLYQQFRKNDQPTKYIDTAIIFLGSVIGGMAYAYGTGSSFLEQLIFMVFSAIIIYAVVFLRRKINLENSENHKALVALRTFIVVAIITTFYVYGPMITELFKGLIKDSNIPFNISNLFDLSLYTIVGIIIVGILFFSFFFITKIGIELIKGLGVPQHRYYFWLVITSAAYVIYAHFQGDVDMILVLWPTTIIIVISVVVYRSHIEFGFSSIVILLIIFSLFSAHTLSKYTGNKEHNNRLVYAEKLSSEEDPVTELLFAEELEDDLRDSDVILQAFDSIGTFSKSDFERTMEDGFFNDYWDRYEVHYYLFRADSTPIGIDPGINTKELTELDRIVKEYSEPSTLNHNIYYIRNSIEKLSYLIKMRINSRDGDFQGFFYCELKSKKIPEEIGFPELLLDKNTRAIEELANYSYARYFDGVQVTRLGSYKYSTSIKPYLDFKGRYAFMEVDNHDHLVYKVDTKTVLILSKERDTFLARATMFSYPFALFSIILLLVLMIRELSSGVNVLNLGLKSKIQLLLVGLILMSLFLFGLGTRYFIQEQYKEKNDNLISEKINSVLIEVTHKLGGQDELSEDVQNYMNYILNKFSKVFFTDINLYDINGDLFASSRKEIFNHGLLSRKINPEAYLQLVHGKKVEFIHEEQIGNMRYLSAYRPFMNKEGKLLAYLNLPYFAKQNELEQEISGFLIAIINIFVLLFALSILAALFVSNWITRPLKLLESSLSNVELDKTNKPIEYHGKDEIGSLVNEYNKKVKELQTQAELLAKSERESAWREMAKQVAHEIKNPLTPMKLSVQHLERSYDPDDPDFQDKIERFASKMIQQIETLTTIANEFSNFAKMPKARIDKVDLKDILRSSIELFNETKEIEIVFNDNNIETALINADKEQLLRVFNNLIKNGIQSIPDNQEGKIEVLLSLVTDQYVVEIKDNGSGIPEDQQDKIFVPNFTTKSTGMGLGLAMVRNIVDNLTGKVWFDTEVDKGTSFYVSIPAIKE